MFFGAKARYVFLFERSSFTTARQTILENARTVCSAQGHPSLLSASVFGNAKFRSSDWPARNAENASQANCKAAIRPSQMRPMTHEIDRLDALPGTRVGRAGSTAQQSTSQDTLQVPGSGKHSISYRQNNPLSERYTANSLRDLPTAIGGVSTDMRQTVRRFGDAWLPWSLPKRV
ncbi:hypothetical protein VTK73DRAFT_4634 [Phialemonium thermophilum]|uniref:Uncharacterized protein n=1 Tax=Phialemonium thermophilum TaxID=223376 RepID=A0ABR3WSF1_9PEZI